MEGFSTLSHKFAIRFTEAQNTGENEHTSKQETYEQKGESEYVHVNHDHIYQMEIDNLWQRVGGLCAKTIPEYIPALFHIKCRPAVI